MLTGINHGAPINTIASATAYLAEELENFQQDLYELKTFCQQVSDALDGKEITGEKFEITQRIIDLVTEVNKL